ncbi:hypothetical protein BSKO_03828 [Bryopsis sp. KO-2023]|nr:hypothetical protein BSKO_03828 [Bryopsis sp. KO-2023]
MQRLVREIPTLRQSGAFQLGGLRSLGVKEWFSEEQIEKRRKDIKDDMSKGYFDNFKKFRDSKGKIFDAPKEIIPASVANKFPLIQCLTPHGEMMEFPAGKRQDSKASLACVSFREGAKEMLMSWSRAFGSAYPDSAEASLFHISIVQHKMMSIWPFRSMLLGSAKNLDLGHPKPVTKLFHFGSGQSITESLDAENNLSAYAFLLDRSGLVRWRGSGMATNEEIEALVRCTDSLVKGK